MIDGFLIPLVDMLLPAPPIPTRSVTIVEGAYGSAWWAVVVGWSVAGADM